MTFILLYLKQWITIVFYSFIPLSVFFLGVLLGYLEGYKDGVRK